MKRLIIAITSEILSTGILVGQAPDTLWTKTFGGIFGDEGSSIQQTADGGYILCGYKEVIPWEDYDIWLIKTNAYGDTLWTKTFGGNYTEFGNDVQQTIDGGYILCGSTESYGAGNYDVWLIKTNTFGDVVWRKTIGGNSSDYGRAMNLTTDRGYVICGQTWSFGAGRGDVWLIKTTPDLSDIKLNVDVIISDFSLQPNYPNPFNPYTTISWQSPVGCWQTLKIYDLLGSEVATLVNEYKPAGRYEIEFNAAALSSGVYFYQLKAGDFVQTKKMILLR